MVTRLQTKTACHLLAIPTFSRKADRIRCGMSGRLTARADHAIRLGLVDPRG
jgi:hypothetical protein